MSSFGAGYGLIEQLQPECEREVTIAMPTTRRQRRDNSRPSGKTNATASGQANRTGGTVAASVRYAQAAPTSVAGGDLEGRQERSEQEDPGDAVARKLEGIRRPTTAGDRIASARNG